MKRMISRTMILPLLCLLALTLTACASTGSDSARSESGDRSTGSDEVVAIATVEAGDAAQSADPTTASAASETGRENASAASAAGDTDAESGSDAAGAAADASTAEDDRPFSFFVTSLTAMQELSGSEDGFGGDLGGLAGADAICQTIAEGVGAGDRTWRAFLSATSGPDGTPVNAIDRVGEGPWYDANGRLVASSIDGLLGSRPDGDARTVNDLPDEYGVPLSSYGDSHDILTGSNALGRLYSTNPESTCNDWTSSDGSVGAGGGMGGPGGGRGRRDRGMAGSGGTTNDASVMAGHSWPRGHGGWDDDSWISSHSVPGCAAGVSLVQTGPGSGDCVGCAGGYGAIYCFAVTP